MGTLSFSYGKPYGYQGHPETCRWCGDKLTKERPDSSHNGYRGNGFFCSLRCGFQWAARQFGASYEE